MFFLCRFDDFLIYKVKLFLAKTEAEKKEAIKPIPFDFAVQYARELFVFTIALIYCCVTPLTVPFCASYFALAFFSGIHQSILCLFVAKYNFVFVHNPPYVGLDATRIIIERTFIAHVIFLLFMVGLFTFKVLKLLLLE